MPCPATLGPHDAPPHAGQVVRRMLLRRNIVIDAETAQLVGRRRPGRAPGRCAVQAAAPGPTRSRRRLRAAVLITAQAWAAEARHPRFRYSILIAMPSRVSSCSTEARGSAALPARTVNVRWRAGWPSRWRPGGNKLPVWLLVLRLARHELGMFVGSGVAEAGCKSVIGQRLKLSGMRWTVPGAASIATLRCQEASNRWDEIWKRPLNQAAPGLPPCRAR